MRVGMRISALLLGLALVAAACGGDDDSSADAAPIIQVEGAGDTQAAAPAAGEADARGGSDANGAAPANAAGQSDEDAAFAFTACLRDQGLDVDDPTTNADGSIDLASIFGPGGAGGINPNDGATQDAFEACGELLEGASFLPDDDDLTELEDNFLEFTQCLRDQGLDVADPDFSQGFGGGGAGGPLGDLDPSDPAIADELAACQSVFGGGPFGGGNN